MPPKAEAEMSLQDWIDAPWTKLLARGAMIIALPAMAYIGWTLTEVSLKQQATAADLVIVQASLAVRARDNDQFQTEMLGVKSDVATMANRLTAMAIDVATMKGILTEIQRRDLALVAP